MKVVWRNDLDLNLFFRFGFLLDYPHNACAENGIYLNRISPQHLLPKKKCWMALIFSSNAQNLLRKDANRIYPQCCQGCVQKVLLNGLELNFNYSTMSEVCAEKASKEEWLNEILNLTKNASILSACIVQKMKCLWENGLDPNLDNLNNTRSVRWKSLKRNDSLMKMWERNVSDRIRCLLLPDVTKNAENKSVVKKWPRSHLSLLNNVQSASVKI